MPLKILISALGSHGDIHPFLAIAKALRARGNQVVFIAPFVYGELVGKLGFEFVPAGTEEQFERLGSDPDLWHPTKSVRVVGRATAELLPDYYWAIHDRYEPGKTVSVFSTLAMGARIAQEKLGIPSVTVHLAPMVLRSVDAPGTLRGLPIYAWQPRWFKQFFFDLIDEVILDPCFAPGINNFRAAVGLGPVKKILADWVNSPQRVIGLFPDWYAPMNKDWPAQTRLTGFPLYDEADLQELAPDLEVFLKSGDAPIAFTPGSAMQHAREFFAAAVEICRRLHRRGLLVSRFEENFPPDLPQDMMAVVYAPFSRLLPRCAAVIHHGGIGTSAQSIAAGIPQLVVPTTHDQPDNASRLIELGIARRVYFNQFSPRTAVGPLNELLESAAIRQNAKLLAEKLKSGNAMEVTAQLIEGVAQA